MPVYARLGASHPRTKAERISSGGYAHEDKDGSFRVLLSSEMLKSS